MTLSPADRDNMRERAENANEATGHLLVSDVLVLLDALAAAEAEREALKASNHGRLIAAWDDIASLRDQLHGRFEQIDELNSRAEAAEADNARLRAALETLAAGSEYDFIGIARAALGVAVGTQDEG